MFTCTWNSSSRGLKTFRKWIPEFYYIMFKIIAYVLVRFILQKLNSSGVLLSFWTKFGVKKIRIWTQICAYLPSDWWLDHHRILIFKKRIGLNGFDIRFMYWVKSWVQRFKNLMMVMQLCMQFNIVLIVSNTVIS